MQYNPNTNVIDNKKYCALELLFYESITLVKWEYGKAANIFKISIFNNNQINKTSEKYIYINFQ